MWQCLLSDRKGHFFTCYLIALHKALLSNHERIFGGACLLAVFCLGLVASPCCLVLVLVARDLDVSLRTWFLVCFADRVGVYSFDATRFLQIFLVGSQLLILDLACLVCVRVASRSLNRFADDLCEARPGASSASSTGSYSWPPVFSSLFTCSRRQASVRIFALDE